MEHTVSWVTCEEYKPPATTEAEGATSLHVIFAQYSPLALKIAKDLLERNHNVLLLVSRRSSALRHFYDDVMNRTSSSSHLTVIDTDRELEARGDLADVFAEKSSTIVHLILSELDFNSVYSADKVSEPLYRLIAILDHVAHHKDIEIRHHVEPASDRLVRYKIDDSEELLEVVPDIFERLPGESKDGSKNTDPYSATCAVLVDYAPYHNVFIKAVDTYLYTFHMLYDLKVTRIVH